MFAASNICHCQRIFFLMLFYVTCIILEKWCLNEITSQRLSPIRYDHCIQSENYAWPLETNDLVLVKDKIFRFCQMACYKMNTKKISVEFYSIYGTHKNSFNLIYYWMKNVDLAIGQIITISWCRHSKANDS